MAKFENLCLKPVLLSMLEPGLWSQEDTPTATSGDTKTRGSLDSAPDFHNKTLALSSASWFLKPRNLDFSGNIKYL